MKEKEEKENEKDVDALSRRRGHHNRGRKPSKGGEYQKKQKEKCEYCGYVHRGDYCPAKGQQCKACKGWNHFQQCCKKGENRPQKTHRRRYLHEVTESDESDEEGEESDWYGDEFIVREIEIDATGSSMFQDVSAHVML